MMLVQCWDDGVTTDVRLVDLLRRHGAKASFNLNAGLHQAGRTPGWVHEGTEVWRLGWSEMRSVYAGFTIANHSLTHPCLSEMPIAQARRDIAQGREQLQQLFGQAVAGFVYPFGAFNAAVMDAVREAGHVYARTTMDADASSNRSGNPMALHPSCHFLAPDFWQRHEQARSRGVFHFWGHSYELLTQAHWADFETKLARLCSDPRDRWCEVADALPDIGASRATRSDSS
jgi:peptidoglycan/xylan/chitin deacetylase (PgdA/CDA1 family)